MILRYCVVVWGSSETIGFGDFNLKVPLVIMTEYYSRADNMILHYCLVVWGTSETIGLGYFNLKVHLVV